MCVFFPLFIYFLFFEDEELSLLYIDFLGQARTFWLLPSQRFGRCTLEPSSDACRSMDSGTKTISSKVLEFLENYLPQIPPESTIAETF